MGPFRLDRVSAKILNNIYLFLFPPPDDGSMKVFKDIFSGDELFTDSYEVKLVDDVLYEVIGKHVSRTEGDIQLEGANASAEEFDEGTESTSVSGIDFVLDNRLVETGFGSKKDYTV